MKYFKISGSIAVLLQLVGCASITTGTTQNIAVETRSQGKMLTAQCRLSNNAGTYWVSTPGTVTVTRSGSKLMAQCTKYGYQSGVSMQTGAGLQPMVAGNLLLGGIIGGAVDIGTGAAFSYPALVTFEMVRDESIALTTPAPAPRSFAAALDTPVPRVIPARSSNRTGKCFTYSATTGQITGMMDCGT